MRCLAFAEGLNDRGVECVFVTRAFESQVVDLIRASGHHVIEIPPKATIAEDARLTGIAARRDGRELVVTDLCHREALANREELETYHRLLTSDFFVLGLAGGLLTELPADIVVSPYFRTKYPEPVLKGELLRLLGPSYFIFRREFTAVARLTRTFPAEARNILVSVGGSDGGHLTRRIVKALCKLPRRSLSLRVVFGAMYSAELKREVAELLLGFGGVYALCEHETNMAAAMFWADLAITGDGLTKYESAVTGTPSIMMSRSGSERMLNEEFERAGSTVHLADNDRIDTDELADRIRSVLENKSLRMTMSERGKAMTDGRGLERVVAAIPPGVLG